MDPRTYLLYLATWTLVALTPGPAVMYSMAAATRGGFRSGLAAVGGIQTGNFVLFASVALGLGAVLRTSGNAFAILRVIGALYLFFLGGRVLLRSFRAQLHPEQAPAGDAGDTQSAIQGLLVQITNPKALLFVSALLPQFLNPRISTYGQLTVLVLTTIAVDTLVLSSYAFLASRAARSLRESRFKRSCERAYGAALLCFGSRLLVARK